MKQRPKAVAGHEGLDPREDVVEPEDAGAHDGRLLKVLVLQDLRTAGHAKGGQGSLRSLASSLVYADNASLHCDIMWVRKRFQTQCTRKVMPPSPLLLHSSPSFSPGPVQLTWKALESCMLVEGKRVLPPFLPPDTPAPGFPRPPRPPFGAAGTPLPPSLPRRPAAVSVTFAGPAAPPDGAVEVLLELRSRVQTLCGTC